MRARFLGNNPRLEFVKLASLVARLGAADGLRRTP